MESRHDVIGDICDYIGKMLRERFGDIICSKKYASASEDSNATNMRPSDNDMNRSDGRILEDDPGNHLDDSDVSKNQTEDVDNNQTQLNMLIGFDCSGGDVIIPPWVTLTGLYGTEISTCQLKSINDEKTLSEIRNLWFQNDAERSKISFYFIVVPATIDIRGAFFIINNGKKWEKRRGERWLVPHQSNISTQTMCCSSLTKEQPEQCHPQTEFFNVRDDDDVPPLGLIADLNNAPVAQQQSNNDCKIYEPEVHNDGESTEVFGKCYVCSSRRTFNPVIGCHYIGARYFIFFSNCDVSAPEAPDIKFLNENREVVFSISKKRLASPPETILKTISSKYSITNPETGENIPGTYLRYSFEMPKKISGGVHYLAIGNSIWELATPIFLRSYPRKRSQKAPKRAKRMCTSSLPSPIEFSYSD